MAIEAERLLAIFEAKFDALDKAVAKSRANASTGFGGIVADGKKAEDALSNLGKNRGNDIIAYGAELDRLRAKFNPVFAASKQYETELGELNRALAVGAVNANEHSAALAALNARYTALAASSTAASNQMTRGAASASRFGGTARTSALQTGNLAAQLNDIGVQLAGGQSPFLIAIQQGTQINQALGDAGAKGAVTALGGAFASLINPVGLATIATIALGGAAIQYFASVFSGGEKSAETLQKEASLIQEVAAKWGDALPGIKAYADERARLAEQANIQGAAQSVIEGSFEGARTSINDVRSDLGQLIDDLTTMGGKEADVGKLQAAFTILDGKVADQTATAEDAKVVQAALAEIQVSTGIPAANALAEAFGNLAVAIGTASAAAEKARVDAAQAAQVLSPLGTVPPVFSGGGAFQDENQVQNDRANATKSQFQIEQEKAARA
ncbi:MAG: hypothetical protein E5Y74_00480, partial [Mesorhizobium sp.]